MQNALFTEIEFLVAKDLTSKTRSYLSIEVIQQVQRCDRLPFVEQFKGAKWLLPLSSCTSLVSNGHPHQQKKKTKQNHSTILKNSTTSLHHPTIVLIVLLAIITVLKTTACLSAGKQTTQGCWAHSPTTFPAKGENCSLIHPPVFSFTWNCPTGPKTSGHLRLGGGLHYFLCELNKKWAATALTVYFLSLPLLRSDSLEK